jgi:signal transduction histidine kinase
MLSASSVLDDASQEFIANVAHQLRCSLVPVRNAAGLLKSQAADTATVHRVADIIERQTDSMHRLIDDLVDLSRAQLGVLVLHRVAATLSGLMEQVLRSSRSFASERGHTLLVSVAPTPVHLLIDVARLSHALQHIIANACKYTDAHGHIYVRAQPDGPSVLITVSDTGDGIAAGELETIFGLFARSEHPRRVEPGMGLGLYLARRFIEAHGGTVIASSGGVGRGSEFTVKIPCEASAAFGPPEAATAIDPSRA